MHRLVTYGSDRVVRSRRLVASWECLVLRNTICPRFVVRYRRRRRPLRVVGEPRRPRRAVVAPLVRRRQLDLVLRRYRRLLRVDPGAHGLGQRVVLELFLGAKQRIE